MRDAGAGSEGNTNGAQGQLTSSKVPERMGYLCHEKGITFPSKLVSSFQQVANMHPHDFYACSE